MTPWTTGPVEDDEDDGHATNLWFSIVFPDLPEPELMFAVHVVRARYMTDWSALLLDGTLCIFVLRVNMQREKHHGALC